MKEPTSKSIDRAPWGTLCLGWAVALYLGWQLWMAINNYRVAGQFAQQQDQLVQQAIQTERDLRALMLDLIDQAQTDDVAARLVRRYAITYTPETDSIQMNVNP